VTGILVEDGLNVHDRRTIHGLEVPDANAKPVHANDLGSMEPNRVRTMRAPRCEHAFLTSRRVAAGMDAQDIAISEVKPREDEDLVAGFQVPRSVANVGVEDERRLRRSLIGLARGVCWVDQRGFNVTD
jgi:hypothetical protein